MLIVFFIFILVQGKKMKFYKMEVVIRKGGRWLLRKKCN